MFKRISVILVVLMLAACAYEVLGNEPYLLSSNIEGTSEKPVLLVGCVVNQSTQTSGQLVSFTVTDGVNHILSLYNGILPDLFSESEPVYVRGVYDGNHVMAEEVGVKFDDQLLSDELLALFENCSKF